MDEEYPSADKDLQSVHFNRDLDAATALYRAGDEAGAVPLFKELAEAGSAPAMTWVGYVYLEDRGVAVDTSAALAWFLKAAEAGDGEAMGWIGYIYSNGYGVPVDFQLSREWYFKGAQAGDAYAMRQLGQLYFDGNGVDVDRATAHQWFVKASEAGDASAMSWLGYMCSQGIEVPADLDAARLWFSKSAEAGDAFGQHTYASVFLVKAGEYAEADRWLRKASEQGFEASNRYLQEWDAHNLAAAKRYSEALPTFEKLAEDGSAWAHHWLGYMYLTGRGVAKNPGQAVLHYEAAYEGGWHKVAKVAGIANFRAGRPEAALEWFRKETSAPTSSLYWQYRVLNASPKLEHHAGEADELLLKAADAGHLYARRSLALGMIKGQRKFGTRLQGLRMLLEIFPQAFRIGKIDRYDERLR
jgi:TPR repeat protein